MAATSDELPQIVDVEAMPALRRRGRGWDPEPLIAKLRDGKPHAIEDVASEEARKRWRRRVRVAARRAGLGVTTRYVSEEARLYFQSHDATE